MSGPEPLNSEVAPVQTLDPVAAGTGSAPPPKVLFLIDTLLGMGGAEGALLKAVQNLPKTGWRCAIATFRQDKEFLKLFPCPVYDLTLRRPLSWRALSVGLKLRSLVARERFDIVHTFFELSDLWGAPIAWLGGRPILVSSRRDMGIMRTRAKDRAYRLLRGLFQQVQTVSEEVRRAFIARDGLRPERVVTVYNGIDLDRILAAEPYPDLAESFGLDTGGATILTGCGKVYPVKGIDILIRAAAVVCREFPRTNFVVAGWLEGDYPDECRRLAASLGVGANVKFIGRSTRIWSILKSVDIYCLLSRSEGHSNGLLEAMACSLPCVATSVGGNPETVVHAESGFLVPNEDWEAAAQCILRLLRDPDLRRGMGQAGHAVVRQRFTSEGMAWRMASLYEELLASRARKS
jgi:glycosyltransferase involved in cell wall biosynthesis